MPKLVIDGHPVECRPGISVLQAAVDAGWNIPHYCYHPGLSIVASCRLCLMEMKMPDPRSGEMAWVPKLFPSCQTPVKDGLEVRFASSVVGDNQRHVMEYYLVNHPLDCPVCDKAGECYLQDYSEQFGSAASRMVEDKQKNPKKDIGPHTLLYQDRCVLCTRCVRFCQEIAGTGELAVVNRGSRNEIDVFPGRPLDNPLQGNVVDLCPVGALLDKDFLFRQRVWLLKSTKSISPADSRGQTIWIDHNEHGVHRLRPRYNERVNEWWLSDEARFGWKYIHRDDRLRTPRVRVGGGLRPEPWSALAEIVRTSLAAAAKNDAGAGVAAVLSPMLSCEEAWLLASFVRQVAPRATLVVGHVPVVGQDQVFPKGTNQNPARKCGAEQPRGFIIKAEKCPNRRGVETIVQHLGGANLDFRAFLANAIEGAFKAAYLTAGYPTPWLMPEAQQALAKVGFLIVHDLFPSALDERADIQIPGATWAEREGTFMNCDGLVQPFERAIPPLEGVQADGQFFYELAGRTGLYRAATVRAELAAAVPAFGAVFEPAELAEHAH